MGPLRRRLALTATVFLAAAPVRAGPLRGLARDLAKGLRREKVERIAVLDFRHPDGTRDNGCSIVRERLTTYLASDSDADVIERRHLEKVLSELKLEISGVIDPRETHKLGKVLGVGAIVTGTLHELDRDTVEVNARLIHTQTGRILAAGLTTVERTWSPEPAKPPRVVYVPAPPLPAPAPPPRCASPLRSCARSKHSPRTPSHIEKRQLRFFSPPR